MKKKTKMLVALLAVLVVGIFQSITVAAAESKNETTVIVHFSAQGDKKWALWAWPKDGDAKEFAFSKGDQTAIARLDGAAEEVGLLAKSPNTWDYQTEDVFVDTATGLAEVWLDDSGQVSTTPPEDYQASLQEKTVRYHYYREAGVYDDLQMTSWADAKEPQTTSFNAIDDFGAVAEVTYSVATGIDRLTIEVGDSQEQEVLVIPDEEIQDVWLLEGDDTIYYKQALAIKEQSVTAATIEKMDQVNVRFAKEITAEVADKIVLQDDKGQEVALKQVTVSENVLNMTVTTAKDLDLTNNYTLIFNETETPVSLGAVVRTDAFDTEFAYEGDLGALYSEAETTFRVWAPTASKVELLLFDSTEVDAEITATINMERGTEEKKGVYETVVSGDLDNSAYQYRLTFPDGLVNETGDPYAQAATVNGDHSVVLSDSAMAIENFDRMPEFSSPTDAVIYEMHIRDFSIAESSGVAAEKKGKFLGIIESGTKNDQGQPTGLDYLQDLGITHVQILPMFDYGSVDESQPDVAQYNWGYDPKNYNVPEGSYSSDATTPATRIKEMKTMIQGLHAADLRVIMDVVYNHVHSASDHAFNKTVPGYYFRYDENGKLVNGTGVGNDTASERAMMRKYIVDSVSYWAENYKLDGFRFDLMGIHDIETMNEVRAALNEIDPSIIILGEGWDLPTNLPAEQKATQSNADQMPGIAHFNDALRDDVKGHVFDEVAPGFINGATDMEEKLLASVLGGKALAPDRGNYASAAQLIQYTEAHDNLTLYDKLVKTNPDDSEQQRQYRHLLGTSIPLLSQGVPFIHAGQEFMRTKDGDENSYQSPDAINQLDWERAYDYSKNVTFIKTLIAFRKSEPLLRLSSYEEITQHMQALVASDQLLTYELFDDNNDYIVAFNAQETAANLPQVDLTNYDLYLTSVPAEKKDQLAPLSVTIFKQKAKTEPLPDSSSSSETTSSAETVATTTSTSKNKEGQLPQTGEKSSRGLIVAGLVILALVGGVIYYRKKKK